MLQLKGGQQSTLGNFTAAVDEGFFIQNTFGVQNVNTKTYVLFLAQQKPLSFVSGTPVDLNEKLREYNNAEFHHLMPKAYVKALAATQNSVNCLANHCFLSRSENKHLGGVKPSEYRMRMPANISEILGSALCPTSLFADMFDDFVKERASVLAKTAQALVA